MRALLFSMSLFTLLAVGCYDAAPEVSQKETTPPSATETSGDTDHSHLLAEVDKDALASALAANDVTLIEFTATW